MHMESRFGHFPWAALLARHWPWLAAFALLLPAVFLLQPAPIDETRYLAVAWNMHSSGQWLVPWLDGAPYSDKAPLLFWLINLAWSVTGVHVWTARLLELIVALATLPLLASLGRRLGADRPAVQASLWLWLWLGCAAWAGYADIVMFDLLLTVCTLAAWCATPGLAGRRWPGAILAMGTALGAGTLVKGPVALLVGAMPALLAPWWLPSARARSLAFYLRLSAALVVAALLALAWALPAAHAGGAHYADAIFLHQTLGRMVQSFAHARPWWWYLPILPLMLLPWTVSLGRGEAVSRSMTATGASRTNVPNHFAVAAFLPCFVIFSLISGKQPHYLLPLLPALALAIGTRLGAGRWQVVGWRVGLTLVAIGLAVMAGLGWWVVPLSRTRACICGALIVAVGLPYMRRRTQPVPVNMAALGMLAALALCKFAFVIGIGASYDVRPAARRIAAAQRAGTPLLYAGTQHGLFTFAGRLTAPIPQTSDGAAVVAWARAHPQGWVIGSDAGHRYPMQPLYWQAYRGGSLDIWRASDVPAYAARNVAGGGARP